MPVGADCMESDSSDIFFRLYKPYLIIRSIIIFAILTIAFILDNTLKSRDVWYCMVTAIIPIAFIMLFYSLLDFMCKPFLKISHSNITYHYVGKPSFTDVYDWEEIEAFEKFDSWFIFMPTREIRIILKNPNINLGRKCEISISKYSEYSRDEIYNTLTERLNAWHQKSEM